MVGNLHAVNYGKESLAFDLVEEFRIPFADTVCCSLFNLNVLSEDDFREVVFSQDDDDYPIVKQDEIELTDDLESENEKTESESVKGVLLNDKGIKKVIAAFEEKMHSLILYEPLNERLSCQKIIFEQVKHYKRIINGEETKYKSFYYK